ncbi:MAG: ABC transporter ATP-binding protein/permease [Bacteroidetes bacterium]|nr:ABC transporter ATP-binding protein/permease [Bacteroidota bacterium]MCL6102749.1 ABC transporter ATP-binding protein/permease [Bacteroidota bacterium]
MKGLYYLLKRFLPPYKGYVFLNILFNLLGAIFGAFQFIALTPVLGVLFGTQPVVDKPGDWSLSLSSLKDNLLYLISEIIKTSGKEKTLIYLGFFIIVMVILKVGFTYFASFVMVPLRNGVVCDIRNQIYNKILSLPLGFFSEERKGDIIARTTGDVQEVDNSIFNSIEMMFKDPMTILISLFVMIYMSWSLTLFVFLMLPIVAYLIGKVGKSLKKPSMRGQNKMGELLTTIEESLSGLRIIKAFNAEKKMKTVFARQNTEYYHIMNKLMWRRYLAHPMSELLGTMVIVMVLWYGGRLVLSNTSPLSPQAFITYLVFFYSIINPAKSFSTSLYSVQKGLASMERIDMILLAENNIVSKPDAVAVKEFKHTIEYRNVSFRYIEDDVLKNVSLTIEKGKTIALVGQSGSGKSTFVDLLPRFWDLNTGSILVDGIDIRDYKIEDLRGLMGNVNQDPILFNDTFFNNISFGVETATVEEVIAAAKVANAHEFIITSPDGYQTNIGDRGGKLSGGQRQRISIARAVLKNPPILILDEATSALDTESEKLVQEALENLMMNRTSIVIAHRLSTIKKADLICVFHEGEIVERGTHEELLSINGIYKKLHSMQNL